jgi:hypothetical protein
MTTPILTTALARRPRRNPRAIQQGAGGGGVKKSPHNYIAEGAKKLVGAPLGNRNAARRSPESVDRQARLNALVRQCEALVGMAHAMVRDTMAGRETLLALMAEPRND